MEKIHWLRNYSLSHGICEFAMLFVYKNSIDRHWFDVTKVLTFYDHFAFRYMEILDNFYDAIIQDL